MADPDPEVVRLPDRRDRSSNRADGGGGDQRERGRERERESGILI